MKSIRCTNPQARDICISFLKLTIELITKWMPLDEPILMKLLIEIFDDDSKFYSVRQRLSGEYSSHYMNTEYAVCILFVLYLQNIETHK